MDIMYQEVLQQIPKSIEEMVKIKEVGIGTGLESLILSMKYEVFLNSIYSLCENLSIVAHYLHNRRLPLHFHDQKKSC
jgi:hypothetical protein